MKHLGSILLEEGTSQGHGLITITDVVVTPGLEFARVYVSTLKSNPEIAQELNNKAKKFTFLLSKKISMRKMPEIKFIYDDSAEKYERIDLLNQP